jgi:N-acetylglucosaminyl-diphospho-decaprenol L-rhamnosyltransferase
MDACANTSVLIVSFNCWELLNACLKTIYSSDSPHKEIIVIDNNSVDETCENLRKYYPEVRIIENDSNVGHTKAVNQGCRISSGKYILLLDADTEVSKDCVGLLTSFLESHPHISMVSPKTFLADGSLQDSAKNFPAPINGIFGSPSLLTKLFPGNAFSQRYLALTRCDMKQPIKVEYVSAACMLFRRDVFEKVGEWDEGFHSYWVDADWCKRIQLSGGQIYYIPSAVIIHHEQNSRSVKKSPLRIIKFHTGSFRFYSKHYTRGKWDPRRLFAAALLAARALILLGANSFKKSSKSKVDPLTMQRKKG